MNSIKTAFQLPRTGVAREAMEDLEHFLEKGIKINIDTRTDEYAVVINFNQSLHQTREVLEHLDYISKYISNPTVVYVVDNDHKYEYILGMTEPKIKINKILSRLTLLQQNMILDVIKAIIQNHNF